MPQRAPINHIVLKGGDASDAAAVVAGVSSSAAGAAVLHYASATMILVDVDFTFLTGDPARLARQLSAGDLRHQDHLGVRLDRLEQ